MGEILLLYPPYYKAIPVCSLQGPPSKDAECRQCGFANLPLPGYLAWPNSRSTFLSSPSLHLKIIKEPLLTIHTMDSAMCSKKNSFMQWRSVPKWEVVRHTRSLVRHPRHGFEALKLLCLAVRHTMDSCFITQLSSKNWSLVIVI